MSEMVSEIRKIVEVRVGSRLNREDLDNLIGELEKLLGLGVSSDAGPKPAKKSSKKKSA